MSISVVKVKRLFIDVDWVISGKDYPTILSEGKDGLTKSSDSEILNTLRGINGTLVSLRRDVKHVLTHRVLYADFYLLETDVRPELPSDYIWIPETQFSDYAVPRLIEILLESL